MYKGKQKREHLAQKFNTQDLLTNEERQTQKELEKLTTINQENEIGVNLFQDVPERDKSM